MSDQATPSISIIIPVYNDAERVAMCLKRIAGQTMPLDRVEVLVVDNGSDEVPHEVVERFGFARLLEEAQPGSYAARNRALTEARGELLVFTDADCLPKADWLQQGIARLRAHEEQAVIGGGIEVFANDPARPTAVELYDIAYGLKQQAYVDLFHYAATANLFTSRRVMDAVGPFNAELKSSGDAEWGQRAHAAGWPIIYAAEATICHPARPSLDEMLTKARRHAGGRIDLLSQRRDRPSLRHKVVTALRVLLPQVGNVWRGRAALAARGYGFTAWLRMAAVAFTIQYAKAFEMIRTALGGKSVRR